MNIEQAKQIPIEEFMSRLGWNPKRSTQDQFWYLSPLRDEVTPSFKVNLSLNAWYDFGLGQGGDLIDLVKIMERSESVSVALARIEILMTSHSFASSVNRVGKSQPPAEILSAGPVLSKSLLLYLASRGVRPENAAPFVEEIHYRRGSDTYFALGFPNQSGGYELRSERFKGTLGSKDISVVHGKPEHVLLFEGFFDFLTLVAQNGLPEATVIVLNSVVMKERGLVAIQDLHAQSVELYRDNDAAGEQLLGFFRKSLPQIELVDRSEWYSGYKDLNEWYVQTIASQV